MNLYTPGPIIACSSGNDSNVAISIIRLGGFDSLASLQTFFSFDLSNVKARKVFSSRLGNEEHTLDEILGIFFEAPHSYNGENILELYVHGNRLNVDRILNLFIEKADFKLARPGEFTFRALKNKKMSLSQVEGLDLLLTAQTEHALDQGLRALGGSLQVAYDELRDSFLALKAQVEINIDFADDVGAESAWSGLKQSYKKFYDQVVNLHNRTGDQFHGLQNPSIVLFGPPNVGKSTFFNQLVGADRAIVSEIAGTTRDFISESVHFRGSNFRIVDTAGVREKTADKIESAGVTRTLGQINDGFFRILLINNADQLEEYRDLQIDLLIVTFGDKYEFSDKQLSEFQKYCPELFILKAGPIGPLTQESKTGPIGPLTQESKTGPIGPLAHELKTGPIGPLAHEFKTGPIGPLAHELKTGPIGPPEAVLRYAHNKLLKLLKKDPLLIQRQAIIIRKIFHSTSSLADLLESESDIAILSSEIGLIGNQLADLVGVTTADDVLNSIFANFCIGK